MRVPRIRLTEGTDIHVLAVASMLSIVLVLHSNDNFVDDQRMKFLKRRDILSSII